MNVLLTIVAVLVLSGLFIPPLTALAASAMARRHRRRLDRPSPVAPGAHRRSVIVNSLLSAGLFLTIPVAFQSRFFTTAAVGFWRALGEAAAILLVYDFVYYLYHRFALHEWTTGRRIHAVHHSIRTPYTGDSLYIHPLETLGGVSLFLGSIALVGPVGLWSFALAFLIYSTENLFIHSGLDLPFFPFNALTALVRHHDVHHDSMKSGYYASITPIWDIVFRTARAKETRGVQSAA